MASTAVSTKNMPILTPWGDLKQDAHEVLRLLNGYIAYLQKRKATENR